MLDPLPAAKRVKVIVNNIDIQQSCGFPNRDVDNHSTNAVYSMPRIANEFSISFDEIPFVLDGT